MPALLGNKESQFELVIKLSILFCALVLILIIQHEIMKAALNKFNFITNNYLVNRESKD